MVFWVSCRMNLDDGHDLEIAPICHIVGRRMLFVFDVKNDDSLGYATNPVCWTDFYNPSPDWTIGIDRDVKLFAVDSPKESPGSLME